MMKKKNTKRDEEEKMNKTEMFNFGFVDFVKG